MFAGSSTGTALPTPHTGMILLLVLLLLNELDARNLLQDDVDSSQHHAAAEAVATAAPRRFTTGLIYNEKFLKASRNNTRRDYRTGRTRADLVKSLGARGPNAVSMTDLALAACDSSSIGPECVDVLLLALTPAEYSSNDTADTPEGNALISPAQDQGGCYACAGFAGTAAAEAAVNAYLQQDWQQLSLSEQDFSFCRLFPRVDCVGGGLFDDLVEDVEKGEITAWASRSCYPYAAAAAGDCVKAEACDSQLPEDGKLSMAYDGSALGNMAQVKEQIMLHGGVMTAMAVTPEFYSYTGLAPAEVFDGEIPEGAQPEWHAVFCFGWADVPEQAGEGYWMCKNSWGPSFGLQGNFKIAYGAAYIMPPDYTFAMQFGPASTAAAAAAISTQLKGCFVQDQQNQHCLLYRPKQPTRLVYLADMLGVLALHASISGGASTPSRADILADLVLSNLGVVADLAAVIRPGKVVKVCGSSTELLAGLVRTPKPITQGDCSAIPNSVKANGSCTCSRDPYTVAAAVISMSTPTDPPGSPWKPPWARPQPVEIVQVKQCLSRVAVSKGNCPAAFPAKVKASHTGWVRQCISSGSYCPKGYQVALYDGDPPTRQECVACAKQDRYLTSCEVLCGSYAGFSIPVTAEQRLTSVAEETGMIGKYDEFLVRKTTGCASTSSTTCPARSLPFHSAKRNFRLDACSFDTACSSEARLPPEECKFIATKPGESLECVMPPPPAKSYHISDKLAYYTVQALSESSELVGCLELASDQACPIAAATAATTRPHFPVEVVEALPDKPACGNSTNPCTSSRTIKCLAPGADCPASHPFMLYTLNKQGKPELAECRAERKACDLTAAGMTNSSAVREPNAQQYGIPMEVNVHAYNSLETTNIALEGCLVSGSSTCPSPYEPTYSAGAPNGSRTLVGCQRQQYYRTGILPVPKRSPAPLPCSSGLPNNPPCP